MNKILCYGSLNLDYVYAVEHFVNPGETLASDSLVIHCGGKGLNQSIAAVRAGGKVYHAGKIGNNGDMLKDFLSAEGVDLSFLSQCDTPNGHAIIQVDTTGQNCILLFAGSNFMQTREEIDKALEGFDSEDYLILQNEINEIPYIIEKASEKGMKIVLNPSPITPSLFNFPLDKVTLLVLNETEGEALSGKTEPKEITRKLYEKYGAKILLTLGKDGAVYFDGNEEIYQGIYNTAVVDTTAAGDTFTGYFVQLLASGMSPASALDNASKASAITVSRAGAAPSIPTLDEVKNYKI